MDFEEEKATLNPDIVQAVFKQSFKSENARANKEAIQLSTEFLRLFVIEAVHRSSEEQDGNNSSSKEITTEHLERILPQLLLDF